METKRNKKTAFKGIILFIIFRYYGSAKSRISVDFWPVKDFNPFMCPNVTSLKNGKYAT